MVAVTVAGCCPADTATTARFGTCAAIPASVGSTVIVPPLGKLMVVCLVAVVLTPAPTGVGAAGKVIVVSLGSPAGAASTRVMLRAGLPGTSALRVTLWPGSARVAGPGFVAST